ncbi:MAG: GlsB/YeaQ/YmgE family stress response membrane protein [Deltaproteobacteria bacterium]|nr:GlsB/YeaQ/YmgE family stress response membrane protein [Deltaproteobacteria bacterium]MCW5803761.1 GlsB/YeaQ/YmgE family stress response membrane protein [Deltaproteobacteria bacterium]
MDVLMWLAVGVVTGAFAHALVPPRRETRGVASDILLGIAGAVLGGWLFEELGWSPASGLAGEAVLALFGAIVCLALERLVVHAIRPA